MCTIDPIISAHMYNVDKCTYVEKCPMQGSQLSRIFFSVTHYAWCLHCSRCCQVRLRTYIAMYCKKKMNASKVWVGVSCNVNGLSQAQIATRDNNSVCWYASQRPEKYIKDIYSACFTHFQYTNLTHFRSKRLRSLPMKNTDGYVRLRVRLALEVEE